jgi:hypothetical protein
MCAFAVMSNKQTAFAYLQLVDAVRWLLDWGSFIGYCFLISPCLCPPHILVELFFLALQLQLAIQDFLVYSRCAKKIQQI